MGVFGRVESWKGQHVAVHALKRLPDVDMLVVGAVSDETYACEVRATAQRLGVDDRVRFLGFREDVARLMKLVDVVVHTSTVAEPFGRVIVEGMLAGKPVVATDAGGAREIVDDAVTGLLVQPGDPDALAGAIAALLGDPDRAASLAAAGYAHACANFTVDRMLNEDRPSHRRIGRESCGPYTFAIAGEAASNVTTSRVPAAQRVRIAAI